MTASLIQIERALGLGAQIAREVQGRISLDAIAKLDRSPVTVADLAVQAAVILCLQKDDESFSIVAEEDLQQVTGPEGAEILSEVTRLVQGVIDGVCEDDVLAALGAGSSDPVATGSYWILDPIDGTKGFLRREQYAIALARYEGGELTLGGLGCPNLVTPHGVGVFCFAARGDGAWCSTGPSGSRERLRVSTEAAPSELTLTESVESGHSSHSWSSRISAALQVHRPPLRLDSQCKYAAVALGQADAYLRLPVRPGYREKVWDHAAGVIVVEEAGGVVTDINGDPLRFDRGVKLSDNAGTVVTNGLCHEAVLAAIKSTSP